MKNFYVGTDHLHGTFAEKVRRNVFRGNQYTFIDISMTISEILSIIGSRDTVHLDLGSGDHKIWELMKIMIDAKYKGITVLILEADFMNLYFKEVKAAKPLLKLYYSLFERKKVTERYLKKIEKIYVMNSNVKHMLERKLKLKNVVFLPHIVAPESNSAT